MRKTIFILGGYGGTGRLVAEYLVKFTDVDVVIGGLNKDKAAALAAEINEKFGRDRARAAFADATRKESLLAAFQGVDLVIDATTATKFVSEVARATIESGADFLDYHFDQSVPEELEPLKEMAFKSGRTIITQAGFHPGLPAPFIRYGAKFFDRYDKGVIVMAMSAEKIPRAESAYEIVDVIQSPSAEVYKDGKWRLASVTKDILKAQMEKFGHVEAFPIEMNEIKKLPQILGLKETGVYVVGFNWFVDWVLTPFAYITGLVKKGLWRHFLASLFVFGVNNFKPRGDGVVFKLLASGVSSGKEKQVQVTAIHSDSYAFTAIPVVACVRQYLDGGIKKPGLYLMGEVVDPEKTIKDLKTMGVKITETQS